MLCGADISAVQSDLLKFDSAQAIERYDDGKLRMGISSEDQVVSGIRIPKGVFVYFDKEGHLDMVGFREKHFFNRLVFSAEGFTSFYRPVSGKPARIKSGRLDTDQNFGSFRLKGGTDTGFYESGALMNGTVVCGIVVHGVKIAAGEHFFLHPNGYVSEIHNEWGMSSWDNTGHARGHKQLLRED
jgi:hypothetical protein